MKINNNVSKMISKLDEIERNLVNEIIIYNRKVIKYDENFITSGFSLSKEKKKITIKITKKKIVIETNMNIDVENIKNISKKLKVSNEKIEIPISKMISLIDISNIMKYII